MRLETPPRAHFSATSNDLWLSPHEGSSSSAKIDETWSRSSPATVKRGVRGRGLRRRSFSKLATYKNGPDVWNKSSKTIRLSEDLVREDRFPAYRPSLALHFFAPVCGIVSSAAASD